MTTATVTRHLLDVLTEGRTLPDGYDTWGVKSVRDDLTTYGGFQWPGPGGVARSDDNLVPGNTASKPKRPGDGLCVATDWAGMRTSGIQAETVLLVAYRRGDVAGASPTDAGRKSVYRVGGPVLVVARFDVAQLIRDHGAGMSLYGIGLSGIDLRGIDLRGIDLREARLLGTLIDLGKTDGADFEGAWVLSSMETPSGWVREYGRLRRAAA